MKKTAFLIPLYVWTAVFIIFPLAIVFYFAFTKESDSGVVLTMESFARLHDRHSKETAERTFRTERTCTGGGNGTQEAGRCRKQDCRIARDHCSPEISNMLHIHIKRMEFFPSFFLLFNKICLLQKRTTIREMRTQDYNISV